MKNTKFLCLLACSLLVTACGGNNNSGGDEEEYAEVIVFSGQSNMEGNSNWRSGNNDYLKDAFNTLGLTDYDDVKEGMPEVMTTFMGAGYGYPSGLMGGDNNIHASFEGWTPDSTQKNNGNPREPYFLPTRAGMGADNNKIGPEFGCAYKLRELADSDKPIYFIKAAFSGSGFDQGQERGGGDVKSVNWKIQEDNDDMYHNYFKPYVQKGLEKIEELSGLTPRVRAWCWHQGESDASKEKNVLYRDRLNELVTTFRNDFADYAKDSDADEIAFIDGMINDKSGNPWGDAEGMNQVKQNYADENDMNFVVNTSYVREGGLKLEVGSPGGDSMHYCTKDSLRLGMAYADIIIENGLLD